MSSQIGKALRYADCARWLALSYAFSITIDIIAPAIQGTKCPFWSTLTLFSLLFIISIYCYFFYYLTLIIYSYLLLFWKEKYLLSLLVFFFIYGFYYFIVFFSRFVCLTEYLLFTNVISLRCKLKERDDQW